MSIIFTFLTSYWRELLIGMLITFVGGIYATQKLEIHSLQGKLDLANKQLVIDANSINTQNASILQYKNAAATQAQKVADAETQIALLTATYNKKYASLTKIPVPPTCNGQIKYLRSQVPALSNWP